MYDNLITSREIVQLGSQLIRVPLVFCVNATMYGAFRVALHTYIRFAPSGQIVYIMHTNLSDRHLAQIKDAHIGTDIRAIKVETKGFHSYRSLHGDYTTYTKLLIPTTLNQENGWVLYVDADTACMGNLQSSLSSLQPDGLFAAVPQGAASSALDWKLYASAGLSSEDTVFNAGVMAFHCKRLRDWDLIGKAHTFAQKNAANLRSADQPIFNVLLSREFAPLPRILNQLAWPDCDPEVLDLSQGIWHFVGSPKPWDLGGNSGGISDVYKKLAGDAGMTMRQVRCESRLRNVYRNFRIGRSILKKWLRR